MKWPYEERRHKLKELCDIAGREFESGMLVFNSEFVDYTEDNEFIVKYDILPWHRNPMGNLQGGIICTMIDDTAGALAWVSLACEAIGTIDLNTNFIRAADEHDSFITTKAKVISIGRRIVNVHCEVYNDKGFIIATASTNLIRLLAPDDKPIIV